MDNVRGKMKALINEVMSIDIDKMDNNLELSKIDQWDSFNHLSLISRIEKDMGIKFQAKDFDKITTVNTFVELVRGKAGKK